MRKERNYSWTEREEEGREGGSEWRRDGATERGGGAIKGGPSEEGR